MQDKSINVGGALSTGGENVRPSRDVQSLLIPESPGFSRGEYVKVKELKEMLQKVEETKEVKVAVPPNMAEGVYPVAVVLPNNAYILLGSKK